MYFAVNCARAQFTAACAELSPLLAWFGSLALEGASGPLLELGRSLLVGGGSNGCVGHLFFVCYEKNQEEVKCSTSYTSLTSCG